MTDQRRRFRINGANNEIIEIEPLVHWQNLTYVGGKVLVEISVKGDLIDNVEICMSRISAKNESHGYYVTDKSLRSDFDEDFLGGFRVH